MDCVKRLILPHAFNLRDLGGFVTKDGKTVRWQKLYRADALCALTEAEWQTLAQKGVRTVVDLRSLSETEMMPDRVPNGVSWVHCPLQAENMDFQNLDEGAMASFRRSMAESYTDMVTKTPNLLAKALCTVVSGLQNGAVIFHCTAGKDRTGVLAASILHLLGAYDADILADYMVSELYNRGGVQRMAHTLPNFQDLLPLLSSAPENMEPLLEFFHTHDFPALLAEHGFGEAQLQTLRAEVLG
ncbi:MAG: tyrosine-protein phosphatase [Candidatus Fimenecus sp.]